MSGAAYQDYVPRAGNLDPVGDGTAITHARFPRLYFIPSTGNPTLAGGGEFSYQMDADGIRVHRWMRFVGQGDFYHYIASSVANVVANVWGSATLVTGLIGGPAGESIGEFPYVRRRPADGKFYLAYASADRTKLYLASSTDGNAFTTLNGGSPILSRTNDPTDHRYQFGNPAFAFGAGTDIHWLMESWANPAIDGGTGTAPYSYTSALSYGKSTLASPAFTLAAGDDNVSIVDGAAAQLEYDAATDTLVTLFCEQFGFEEAPYGYMRGRFAWARTGGGANVLTNRRAWHLGPVLVSADEIVDGTGHTQRSDYELMFFPAASGVYRGIVFYNFAQADGYTELLPDALGIASWSDMLQLLTGDHWREEAPSNAGIRLIRPEPYAVQVDRQPRVIKGAWTFTRPVRGLPTATVGHANKAPGTNYAATGSYADTGLQITLPGPGLFRITACVYVYTVANVQGTLRLWNSTDSAQVGTAKGGGLTNAGDNDSMITLIADVTVTAAKTIKVQAIGVGMTVQSGNPPGDPAVSEIFYMKLSD
jgi:hypothetical protein